MRGFGLLLNCVLIIVSAILVTGLMLVRLDRDLKDQTLALAINLCLNYRALLD